LCFAANFLRAAATPIRLTLDLHPFSPLIRRPKADSTGGWRDYAFCTINPNCVFLRSDVPRRIVPDIYKHSVL
jgi:hypothetical protein